VAKREPVRPTLLFNLASCTKAITGAAVLKLVDEGKLSLDDRVLPLLEEAGPRIRAPADPRFRKITVRQMLHHAAGLSTGQGASDAQIAKRLEVGRPINLRQLTAFTLTRWLRYDPGTGTGTPIGGAGAPQSARPAGAFSAILPLALTENACGSRGRELPKG